MASLQNLLGVETPFVVSLGYMVLFTKQAFHIPWDIFLLHKN